MNVRAHFPTVSLVGLLALGACASSAGSSTDNSDLTDNAHSTLSGTYTEVGDDGIGLGYTTLTFKSGGKFSAKHGDSTVDGTFKISKAGTEYQIKLDDADGNGETLYETWDGYQLTLDQDSEGNISTSFFNASWTKHIPIGDVCQNNAGKSLGECSDDGNFGCGPDGTDGNLLSCIPLD